MADAMLETVLETMPQITLETMAMAELIARISATS
jgi:hypothetical protein